MRHDLCFVTLSMLSGCGVEPASAPPFESSPVGVPEQPGETIASDSGWELTVVYRHKGSRSEAQHGLLLRDGQRIEDGEVGELMETPLGRMRFYGPMSETLMYTSGWHYADPEKKKPSWAR